MEDRVHALLAGRLIAACGGVDEIVRAQACRVSRAQLYRYANPAEPDVMAADVIACLEAYCGQPVYSRALVEWRPYRDAGGSARDEASEITEAAASVQRAVRLAAEDRVFDAGEIREIERGAESIALLLQRLLAAVHRGRA